MKRIVHNYAINSNQELEEQLNLVANCEAYKNENIILQADAHKGASGPIGFTSTFSDKIVPNTVGVDVACRVSLYALEINERDLSEDFFKKFDKMVEERIPTGFNVRNEEAEESRSFPYEDLKCYDALKNIQRIRNSMGTLGGGRPDCLQAA